MAQHLYKPVRPILRFVKENCLKRGRIFQIIFLAYISLYSPQPPRRGYAWEPGKEEAGPQSQLVTKIPSTDTTRGTQGEIQGVFGF